MNRTRRHRGENGQALVELAFALPALLLILFGIVQFGALYNHYVSLTNATRAGARVAAVSRTAGDPVAAATQAVRDSAQNLNQTDLNVTVTPSPPWSSGGEVTVTATYPYSVSIGGVVVHAGTLASTTKERIE